MQPDTFGIVSYEILLNLFDRKGTIEISWICVIVRRVDNTTLVRQSGAHLSFIGVRNFCCFVIIGLYVSRARC